VSTSGPDDAYWRRPSAALGANSDGVAPGPVPPGSAAPSAAGTDRRDYQGPPPSLPPDPAWRPEVVIQPPPPRALPNQDHAALDAQEQSARTLTYGFGLVAAAIILVLTCALCSRLLF
jgi:hypothetical protein